RVIDVHKPLHCRAENKLAVAAPAVGVAVFDLAQLHKIAGLFQRRDYPLIRFATKDLCACELVPSLVGKPAGSIDRAKDFQTVFDASFKVFLAMTGSGVD